MYSALEVAAYIIKRCNELRTAVSNLKLQKLLYFVQVYFLINNDVPCFYDDIEAWNFGPVVPAVYHEYKYYGGGSIPYFGGDDGKNIRANDKKMIDEVIEMFADNSAAQLVKITHNQTPWKKAYVPYFNNVISIESLREYFCGDKK